MITEGEGGGLSEGEKLLMFPDKKEKSEIQSWGRL